MNPVYYKDESIIYYILRIELYLVFFYLLILFAIRI